MTKFTSVINFDHFSEDAIKQVAEQGVGKPFCFGGPFISSGRIGVVTSAERIENTNDLKFEFEVDII